MRRDFFWIVIAAAVGGITLPVLAYFLGSSVGADFLCYSLAALALLGGLGAISIRSGALVLVAGLIMFGAIAYPWISAGFFRVKLSAAKEYAARVAPQLENYRKAHGSYPAELRGNSGMPAMPFYLSYQLSEKGYEFRLPDKQSIGCDEYVYDGAAGEWWVDN